MGGKGKAPPPIDPGESAIKYIESITDPELQRRIISAERIGRPEFAALELADIRTFAQGIPGGEVEDPRFAQAQERISELQAQLGQTPKTITTTQPGRMRGSTKKVTKANPEYARLQSEIASQQEFLGTISPTMMREATPGVFDLLEQRAFELQQAQLQAQRAADVGALQEFAPQVVEAYRTADPRSAELADLAQQQAVRLFGEAEGPLSPERRRLAEQAARQASLARGRIGDESAIAAELLGREQFRAGLRQEARQAGAGAFGQQRALAGDVGMTLLGRPSQAIQLGGQTLGQATGLAAQPIGPQLFDPNVGINLALQQRAQDIEFMGAQQQASAGVMGGALGALGRIGAAKFTGGASLLGG
jgi:hypothetical protein